MLLLKSFLQEALSFDNPSKEKSLENFIKIIKPQSHSENIFFGCRGVKNEKLVVHVQKLVHPFTDCWKISINDLKGNKLDLHHLNIDTESKNHYLKILESVFVIIKDHPEFKATISSMKTLIFHFPKSFSDLEHFYTKLNAFLKTHGFKYSYHTHSFDVTENGWIYFSEEIFDKAFKTYIKVSKKSEDNLDDIIDVAINNHAINQSVNSADEYYPIQKSLEEPKLPDPDEIQSGVQKTKNTNPFFQYIIHLQSKLMEDREDISEFNFINFTYDHSKLLFYLDNLKDFWKKYNKDHFAKVFYSVSEFLYKLCKVKNNTFDKESTIILFDYCYYLNSSDLNENLWPHELDFEIVNILKWIKSLYPIINDGTDFPKTMPILDFVKGYKQEINRQEVIEKWTQKEDIKFSSFNLNFFCIQTKFREYIFSEIMEQDVETKIIKTKIFFDEMLDEVYSDKSDYYSRSAALLTDASNDTFKGTNKTLISLIKYAKEMSVITTKNKKYDVHYSPTIYKKIPQFKKNLKLEPSIILDLYKIISKDNKNLIFRYDYNFRLTKLIIDEQKHYVNHVYFEYKDYDNLDYQKNKFDEILSKLNLSFDECKTKILDYFNNRTPLLDKYLKSSYTLMNFCEWFKIVNDQKLFDHEYFLFDFENPKDHPETIIYSFSYYTDYLEEIKADSKNLEVETFKIFLEDLAKHLNVNFYKPLEIKTVNELTIFRENLEKYDISFPKKITKPSENKENFQLFISWIKNYTKSIVILNTDDPLNNISMDVYLKDTDEDNEKKERILIKKIISEIFKAFDYGDDIDSSQEKILEEDFLDHLDESERLKLFLKAKNIFVNNEIIDQVNFKEIEYLNEQFKESYNPILKNDHERSNYNDKFKNQFETILNTTYYRPIKNYTGGSGTFNKPFRRLDKKNPHETEDILALIKMFFTTGVTIDESLIVVRGSKSNKWIGDKVAGDFIIEPGFLSTTIRLDTATDDFNQHGGGGMIYQIYFPKGMKGIYVEGVTSVKGEQEVLLPPGCIFKILSVENRAQSKNVNIRSDFGFLYKLLYIGSATVDMADKLFQDNKKWLELRPQLLPPSN